MSVIPQPPIQPIRDQALVLPLLSFSTGAADGFAYLALGGNLHRQHDRKRGVGHGVHATGI